MLDQVAMHNVSDLGGRQFGKWSFSVIATWVSGCWLLGPELLLEQALGIAGPCRAPDHNLSPLINLVVAKSGIVTEWDLLILLLTRGLLVDGFPDPDGVQAQLPQPIVG